MRMIDTERTDIEALLPWHAAGSLNRRDAERLENMLAGDRELARRLDLAHAELRETIRLNEALGMPSERARQSLFARIDAELARASSALSGLAGPITRFIAGLSPRTLAWSASAAALVLALQAGIITAGLVGQQAGPVTELASVGASNQALAVIRFDRAADAAAITAFLLAHKASVVDGPGSDGIYTIRLPETGQARDDLIRRMQAQPTIVEFVATLQ
jgi:hypothetical protein